MLDSDKEGRRPYRQKYMRSVLQSVGSVEDSQKLLKDWLVKPQTHAFGLHSASIFQKIYPCLKRH